MSFNGSGTYIPPAASYPPITRTKITIAKFTALIDDMVTALSSCVLKDGQQTITASIPMSTFKLTGLGAGTAKTDSASVANLQSQTGVYCVTTGTGDTIVLTPSPAWTAYAEAGMAVLFHATAANTTAVTLNVSGLGAKALTKNGTSALAVGDIPAAQALVWAVYDGTRFVTKV